MIDEATILKIARELIKAEDERNPIDPISERLDLTIEDAYKVQLKVIELKNVKCYVIWPCIYHEYFIFV